MALQQISTRGINIWRLALLQDTKACKIVGAGYSGEIVLMTETGRICWQKQAEGFIFHLAVSSRSHNLRRKMRTGVETASKIRDYHPISFNTDPCIAAACADGCIYLFNQNGKLLWKRDTGYPVYQVCFAGGLLWAGNSAGQLVGYNLEGGRVSNREFSGCIRNLTAGDITGDGVDYIVVVTFSRSAPWTSAQYHIISAGKEDHLAPLYSDSYSVKTDEHGFQTILFDLDNDGQPEILCKKGYWKSGESEMQWHPFGWPKLRPPSYDYHYRMTHLTAGNFS
jgi:hypothetical protein